MLGIEYGTNSFSDVHDNVGSGKCSYCHVLHSNLDMFFSVYFLAILQLQYQQRWQARPDLCNVSLGQAPCYKSAEGRCRRQRPEAVIIP